MQLTVLSLCRGGITPALFIQAQLPCPAQPAQPKPNVPLTHTHTTLTTHARPPAQERRPTQTEAIPERASSQGWIDGWMDGWWRGWRLGRGSKPPETVAGVAKRLAGMVMMMGGCLFFFFAAALVLTLCQERDKTRQDRTARFNWHSLTHSLPRLDTEDPLTHSSIRQIE